LLRILVALSVTSLSTNAAFAYCAQPSAPYCSTSYGQFSDEWEFERCKNEMVTYQSETERYVSCRNDEAQEAIEEANSDNRKVSSDYSEAVENFNRRANQ
jgi:hypothetical protein